MTYTQPAPAPKKKSIWKNKWTWIVIAGLLVVGGIGNAITGGERESPAASAPDEVPVADVVKAAVPDVTGLSGKDAEQALRDAGFTIERDGGAESVVALSNWDATGTTPAAGSEAEAGASVQLHLVRATERLAAEQAERDAAALARANAPIEEIEAQTFCDAYAQTQFPFGVKLHTVVGVLAEEQTETGWYLKYEATITNAYKAKQAANVECHISGTNGTPVMDSFLAY